jgi:sugar lactone lactonase YvrE
VGVLAPTGSGELFVIDKLSRAVLKINTRGVIEATVQDIDASDIALNGNGKLIVADLIGKIWCLEGDGSHTVIAGRDQFSGDGGPAREALLKSPRAVAVDSLGALFIADTGNNRIRKVSADGVITTVAGAGDAGFNGDGGPAAPAQVTGPDAPSMDQDGNLYFSARSFLKVRRLRTDGIIETIAGTGEYGGSGDGGPATAAMFKSIGGLAVDRKGKLYISDPVSNRIRLVTPDGQIDTYAGTGEHSAGDDGIPALSSPLSGPSLLTIDPDGNLVVYEQDAGRLRRVAADTGVVTTLSKTIPFGVPSDELASRRCVFTTLSGLTFDLDGSLLVAGNSVICRLTSGGASSVVAGSGPFGFAGDGGPAAAAQLWGPSGLAIDGAGALSVADTGNHRVRQLTSLPVASTTMKSTSPEAERLR